MNAMRVKSVVASGAAVMLGLFAAGAPAAPFESDALSIEVSFADLDLSRQEGAEALYARIRAAARTVCEPLYDSRSLQLAARHRRCIDEAVAGAVKQVDRATLTAVHRVRAAQPRVG